MNAIDRWASDPTGDGVFTHDSGYRTSGPGATRKEGSHLSTPVFKAYKEWNRLLPPPEKYIDISQCSEPKHGYEPYGFTIVAIFAIFFQ